MLSCSRQRRILSKKLLLIDIPTNSMSTFPGMLYTCLVQYGSRQSVTCGHLSSMTME